MFVVEKYNYISSSIQALSSKTTLVVVTKNQDVDKINSLINLNHIDFGENRVQEATQKWKNLILNNSKLRLHLIGKLQSNKAKDAFDIFNYIHTLDNAKLAKIFSNLESNSLKKIKYFIQVNIANEQQKNGISINDVNQFIKYCIQDLKLNIIGLMCIPPNNVDPHPFFEKMQQLKSDNNLNELSMGMSSDYKEAADFGSTYLRIGSAIFK
jgi:pyridoxal phosphate enzyme (YggS family)